MNQSGIFTTQNINNPTNQDINVAFTPAQIVKHYMYTVYQNENVISTNNIENNEQINIKLTDSGNYKIVVKAYDSQGVEYTQTSENYIIDKVPPTITIDGENIQLKKGDTLIVSVNATDNVDGNITQNIKSNQSAVDLDEIGSHTITYTVSDQAGNVTSKSINVNVTEGSSLIIFQAIIFILLALLILLLLRMKRTLKLEKRIEKFSIKPIKDNKKSLSDTFANTYHKINSKIASKLEKSVVLTKYASKLEKYVAVTNFHKTGMEIIVGKIITSILLVLIAIFAKTIQLKLIEPSEIVIPLIFGFFFLDVIYFTKYRIYRNKLENDLLSAITIMNNAFKSGRSITQAINIVSTELEGVMAKEFKKMSLELSYGLEIDTVFKRFAERVQIEEVNYLTASLTILNKTGSNIIKIFNSIEKSLFNKKKLQIELKSLTSGSRIIVYTLFVVPFLFILFISIINPDYFEPFITTKVGLFLSVIMIVYYIVFIVSVRKIMKVVI